MLRIIGFAVLALLLIAGNGTSEVRAADAWDAPSTNACRYAANWRARTARNLHAILQLVLKAAIGYGWKLRRFAAMAPPGSIMSGGKPCFS
jgi:hypothetical protein